MTGIFQRYSHIVTHYPYRVTLLLLLLLAALLSGLPRLSITNDIRVFFSEDNPQLKRIRIEGHTDSTGKESFNIYLSNQRAKAVREYMISRGISADRLEAIGYGPSRPIANNKTRSGRAANRRVEFTILEQDAVEETITPTDNTPMDPALDEGM